MRLPCDWLGPRADLVPFGPASDPRPAPGDATMPAPAAAGEPAPGQLAAPSAQSFWTADAAALHTALNAQPGPAAAPATAPPVVAATPPEPSTTLRLGRLGAALSGDPRVGARTLAVAGALLVLVALSSASTLLGGGKPGRPGSPEVRSASTSWLPLPTNTLSLRVGRASASVAARVRQARRTSIRRAGVARPHRRLRPRRPALDATRFVTARPSSRSTGSGYQPAARTGATSSTASSAAPVAAATSGEANPATASAPSSPDPPPAFGQGGVLGAGHSS